MGQCPKCGTSANAQQTTCAACGADLASDTPSSAAKGGVRPSTGVTPPAPTGARPPAPSGVRPAREGASARRGRRPGQGAAIPFMAALILSIGLQQVITSVVSPDGYFFRLFRPVGGWMMGVVPGMIAFALFWTLADLILKLRIGRQNERDISRPEINQLPSLVAQEASSVTLQRLRSWDVTILARPVGRRILWILRHLNTADAQRTHELLRHQSDVDADSAASAYRTVKLFIWAMPILGFIGTVLGISLSVGGFSDFLTTSVSIDQIDQVTAELGEVASGLSFAFDTTLLGLLAGLIATVSSSGVERREERLLTRLDELGLRILANATPARVAARAPASAVSRASGLDEEFEQMMRGRLDELSTLMGQFTVAVRSTLGGINDAASRMSGGLETSIDSVSHTVEGLGKNLGGVSDNLSRDMAGMDEASQRLQAVLASSSHQVAAASDRLLAGVESQGATEQAMRELSASISEFGERLSDVSKAQVALAPVLNQLTGPLEIRLVPAQPADPPDPPE
jgi:biopolymer transport protein ExbB/TolQ